MVGHGRERSGAMCFLGFCKVVFLGPNSSSFILTISTTRHTIDCVTMLDLFVKKFADDAKLVTVTDNVSQCASAGTDR